MYGAKAQVLHAADSGALKVMKAPFRKLEKENMRFAYLERARKEGFLLARLTAGADSAAWNLQAGKQFRWLYLLPGNVAEERLRKAGYRDRRFTDRPFRYAEVLKLQRRILEAALNEGYPFAQVRLDSLAFRQGMLAAQLQLEPGPRIVFDSLLVQGPAPLKKKFLQNRLGIKPGMPYSEERVASVSRRLQNLPYVRLRQAPQVRFKNQAAQLELALEKRPASRLDLLLAAQSKPQGGGVLLTGQFDLGLYNPFGGGKQLEVNWQRIGEASQQLKLLYQHPYPLNLPLLIEGNFFLQKEQEKFLNRKSGLRLGFEAPSADQYQLLFQRHVSDLLSEAAGDTLADTELNLFGIGFQRQRLNDGLMPRAGYALSAEVLAGNKRFRFPENTTLREERAQYAARLSGTYALPLGGNLVWVHQLMAEAVISDVLFTNDLLRIGGVNSLRGFQEQSFFVKAYALSRAEAQFRWAGQSQIFLLYDQAWMQQAKVASFARRFPVGLGAGIRLQANRSLFQFIYGLGFSADRPSFPQNSQVHFGYVSRF